jgi:hypothetical protein
MFKFLTQLRLIQIIVSTGKIGEKEPVLIVMDYAFGEQAYETIDELLKPFKKDILLNVESVSWVSGILEGGKGDIMIPNAHINEGTADNFFRKRIKCSNV